MFGAEVKGARRWIFGLQPSEFIKPAFVVLAAWAFTEGGRTDADRAARPSSCPSSFCRSTIVPLILRAGLRPDDAGRRSSGRRCSSWPGCTGSGWSGSAASACVGGFAAFKLSPHVHERVLRFIDPDSTGGMVDTFQVDTALQSILSGGWLGRGPGRGHLQAHPARRAHRLRLRRHRRGIRHDRLHGADPVLRLHRAARPLSRRRATRIRSAASRRRA